MAETRLGAALTDAHRIAQVQLSGEAVAASRLLWSTLDPTNLGETKPEWMALQMTLMKVYDGKAAGLAASYLTEYRSAELGTSAGPIAGVSEFDAERVSRSMDAMGPGRLAKAMGGQDGARRIDGAGVTDLRGLRSSKLASDQAFPRLAGAVRRHVQAGGRRTLAESARRDKRAGGWRRVSDGKPCAFCAMLVTRGPVYYDEETALGMRQFHDDCGCSAEIVYGKWTPTKQEQAFIDAYDRAAEVADVEDGLRVAPNPSNVQDTILYRMRRNDIFNDSVKGAVGDGVPAVVPVVPSFSLPAFDKLPRKTFEWSTEDDIASTNPLYHFGEQYQINCQRAVMAHEMRRLGYDVTARGNYDGVSRILWDDDITSFWEDPATGLSRTLDHVIGKSGVRNEMDSWPDGGRGWITVEWKAVHGAHIFSVEKRNGKPVFMDPQTGNIDVSDYFAEAKSKIGIIRIDDQNPKAKVVDMVAGPNPRAGGV